MTENKNKNSELEKIPILRRFSVNILTQRKLQIFQVLVSYQRKRIVTIYLGPEVILYNLSCARGKGYPAIRPNTLVVVAKWLRRPPHNWEIEGVNHAGSELTRPVG